MPRTSRAFAKKKREKTHSDLNLTWWVGISKATIVYHHRRALFSYTHAVSYTVRIEENQMI